MQLLFSCQRDVGNYLNGHPVYLKGRPDEGLRFDQYSLLALALTHGFVCILSPPPQTSCFWLPSETFPPRSLESSSETARMWYGSNPQQPPMYLQMFQRKIVLDPKAWFQLC